MSLYDLHSNPETLTGYDQRFCVPEFAYMQAKRRFDCSQERFPELERVIIKQPEWAYSYAKYVIHGRWFEAERIIATDPKWAFCYAVSILYDRFPEGEPAIATDMIYASAYAYHVIRGRFPEGEPAIAKDLISQLNYEQMLRDIKRRIIPQRFIS